MKEDHQLLGKRRRKEASRSGLAHLNAKRMKRDPMALLNQSMRGRVADLLPLKLERMAASPFGFFRGAVPVMAYDLSLAGNTGIVCEICGDAHVQNLGAYSGPDGRLIFDINDFDETLCGPFEWDVKRMATSLLLAGRDAHVRGGRSKLAAATFLTTYCSLVRKLSAMPVLEVARYQVHRLASIAPISKILRNAERSTPLHLLDRLTEETEHGRRFRSSPPVLRRLGRVEAKSVLGSLKLYAESLLPERRHFLAQFRPVDVAFKVVGTGSVGLRDYCVYMEGSGPGDPLFLQIKEEVPSAYAAYLKGVTPYRNQGQRVADGQRAMQLQSDPMLGWTKLDGRDYLVRQLNDHKASVNVQDLDAEDLAQYAGVCGEMLARGHARSGNAKLIAGYIGGGKQFKEAILTFAEAYAEQSVQDWKQLVQQQGSSGSNLAAKARGKP